MNRNLRWRIFSIFCVLAICFYYVYPTARWAGLRPAAKKDLEKEWESRDASMADEGFTERFFYSLEKWFRGDPHRVINLGLDLKGGMHLVLQIDTQAIPEEARKDAVARAVEILRNRVDEFGIAEPVIFPEGSDRIVVQLPGILDPERALRLIGRTALLEFKLVADDAITKATLARINEKKPILTQIEEEEGRTQDGVSYSYWIIPEKKIKIAEAILASPEVQELIPKGYEFLCGRTLPDRRTK